MFLLGLYQKLPRVRDVPCDRRGGDGVGGREIDLRLFRAHPPDKVPVRRRNHDGGIGGAPNRILRAS